MKPSKIAYETHYSDNSGVEYAVRYDADANLGEVELESLDTIRFPAEKLDWLIAALTEIRRIATDDSER